MIDPHSRLKKRMAGGLLLPLLLLGASSRAEEGAGTIAFVGVWDRVMPVLEQASRDTGVPILFPSESELASGKGLDNVRVLYLLNLTPELVPAIREQLAAITAERSDFTAMVLDHRDGLTPLVQADLVHKDQRVPVYWRANGLMNMRRLLAYSAIAYMGRAGEIEPPVVIPDSGFYLPGVEEAMDTFDAYKARAPWQTNAPIAALVIQQSFWITGDTKVIDAEVAALNQVGFNVVTLFGDREEDVHNKILDIQPDVLIEDRHGAMWSDQKPSLIEQLNIPYLRPISMLQYTTDDWLADPRGLHPVDVGLFLTIQEPKGTIEPVVVGALKADTRGFKLHKPIPGRAEYFARRAWSWVQLRRKPNSDKHIALIYYNKYLGQGDLMQGSPTGAFLDSPASMVRFLARLKEAGYRIDSVPQDEAELLNWMRERGRILGPWQQGEIEKLADRSDSVLIPLSRYQQWFNTKLSVANQQAVIEHFGPPPGKLMVVKRNGQPSIVLPNIRLGNVLLAPQPLRGEKQDEALLHNRDVPPPHNYLAFYWWLQEEYQADALVHWGTHGSLELQPGKETGLTGDDWGDLCVGSMPLVNLWIMDNLAEATLSRRRSYAVLVDHLAPPSVHSGLTDELEAIHSDIGKWETLEPGVLHESFRKRITAATVETGVADTLHLSGLDQRALSDEEIEQVETYLHHVYNSTTPVSLHVLGQPPPDDLLAPYLVTILRASFLERLAGVYPPPETVSPSEGARTAWLHDRAVQWVQDAVLGDAASPPALAKDLDLARTMRDRLREADVEIVNLIRALNGEFIEPGPGPDPVRNRASLPSGRNLYALNPEEIPTRPSWDVAVLLVKQMLEAKMPKKVGIDLNGMNTMRDFGVNEAQILYLMGVEPIWNDDGLAIDVKLIPRAELGRPRIDVFIAMGGLYKENFPTRVKLIDKAVRLAATADEPDNGVRLGSEANRQRLLGAGFSEAQALKFSEARIFGVKPGNMSGTHILYLTPRSGVWEKDDEIASVYIDNMSYVYTGDVWGQKVDGLYEQSIQGVDTLVRVWSSQMTSQLSNHHAYEYLGGLSLAVSHLTGKQPEALIADVRDPDGAIMRDFDEVLATTLRTELLDRKWIEGMKEKDYAGAGQMAELVRNSFGWAVTRRGSISDQVWRDIVDLYVHDKYELDLRAWFEETNPHALQEIAATLMEAARKGVWNADKETLAELAHLYADSVSKQGDSGGLVSGGNERLADEVARHLNAPGDAGLRASYQAAIADSAGRSAPDTARVRGRQLERTPDPAPKPLPVESSSADPLSPEMIRWLIGLLVVLIVLSGFRWARTSPGNGARRK